MSPTPNCPRFKAAAIQASPVVNNMPEWFDQKATLNKAISLINEAARRGARLIVFPECWLPCYTYWCFDLANRSKFFELWAAYLWSSIQIPSLEVARLGEAAKKADAYVVIGVNERDAKYAGRMYNSILYLNPAGQVMGVHRKICITVQERLFHTPGDGGNNLKTVFTTDIGHLGGSICGEHVQLPLLYNWIMQGLEVHCSLWPGTKGLEKYVDLVTRSLCRIGHTFGVMSSACFLDQDMPKHFYSNCDFNSPGSIRGGSGIIGPDGEYIAGPVFDTETIVYGDIDLAEIDKQRFANNLPGYYSRWDLFSLNVKQGTDDPLVPMESLKGLARYPESERIESLESRFSVLEEKVSAIALKLAKVKRRPKPSSK